MQAPISGIVRVTWFSGLGVVWTFGYLSLGYRAEHVHALDPTLWLDSLIPFVVWGIWPYLLGIVGIALPVVLIRTPSLFVRTAAAYVVVTAASFLCFFLFPTNAPSLRPYDAALESDSLTAMAYNALYRFDRTTNLVPSMHVSLATLSMLACAQEHIAYRWWAYGGWLMLVVSVCVTKQHSVVDLLSGAVLAQTVFSTVGIVMTQFPPAWQQRYRSTSDLSDTS